MSLFQILWKYSPWGTWLPTTIPAPQLAGTVLPGSREQDGLCLLMSICPGEDSGFESPGIVNYQRQVSFSIIPNLPQWENCWQIQNCCDKEHDWFHPGEFQDQMKVPQRPNQSWPLARLDSVKLGLTKSGLSGPLCLFWLPHPTYPPTLSPWGPTLCWGTVDIKRFKSLLPTCCLIAILLPCKWRTSTSLLSRLAYVCGGVNCSHQFQKDVRGRAGTSVPLSEVR